MRIDVKSGLKIKLTAATIIVSAVLGTSCCKFDEESPSDKSSSQAQSGKKGDSNSTNQSSNDVNTKSPSWYIQDQYPDLASAPITYADTDTELLDRGIGALVGLATGDAVGVALEFAPRVQKSSDVITGVVGNPNLFVKTWAGETTGCLPGEWTDDTSMALALGESLINQGHFDATDILTKWNLWRTLGFLNVRNLRPGRPDDQKNEPAFDIGTTTARSLSYFAKNPGSADSFPGIILHNTNGSIPSNGSIMRLAPVALFSSDFQNGYSAELLQIAERQSALTHGHPAALDASRVLAHILALAIHGYSKQDVLSAKGFDLNSFDPNPISQNIRSLFLSNASWKTKLRSELIPPAKDTMGGSAEFTLECALWAVSKTDNFRDAILLAINLGLDADTVGAVTGQIAGALYGLKNIPAQWKNSLVEINKIGQLGRLLLEVGTKKAHAQKVFSP